MQYLVFERVGVELKVGREKKEKKKSPNYQGTFEIPS
jgi:hypothetical protein